MQLSLIFQIVPSTFISLSLKQSSFLNEFLKVREFKPHSLKFIDISLNICFPCSYIWKSAPFEFVPVIKYKSNQIQIHIQILHQFFSYWSFLWLKMTDNRSSKYQLAGDNPKGNPSLNMSMLLGMTGLLMSFSHRNLVMSRSCS